MNIRIHNLEGKTMTYGKPEVTLVGSAALLIQTFLHFKLLGRVDGAYPFGVPAYDLDE